MTVPASNGRDWMRIALGLVIATLVYNAAEAAVALWSGMVAGSIALVGFGLDSLIELAAAAGTPVERVPRSRLEAALPTGAKDQGLILEAGPLPVLSLEELRSLARDLAPLLAGKRLVFACGACIILGEQAP